MPKIVDYPKHDDDEFGGVSTRLLSPEELRFRLCTTKHCGEPAATQFLVPGDRPVYWLLCKRDVIRIYIQAGVIIGDPDIMDTMAEVAGSFGMQWSNLLRVMPRPEPTLPLDFRCLQCGGGMNKSAGLHGPVYAHLCTEKETA